MPRLVISPTVSSERAVVPRPCWPMTRVSGQLPHPHSPSSVLLLFHPCTAPGCKMPRRMIRRAIGLAGGPEAAAPGEAQSLLHPLRALLLPTTARTVERVLQRLQIQAASPWAMPTLAPCPAPGLSEAHRPAPWPPQSTGRAAHPRTPDILWKPNGSALPRDTSRLSSDAG